MFDATAEELGMLATVSPALCTSQEILGNKGTDTAHEQILLICAMVVGLRLTCDDPYLIRVAQAQLLVIFYI
jgi:hypothetical protein